MYKIGDKVIIRKDLKIDLSCYSSVVHTMLGYHGKIAKIVSVNKINSLKYPNSYQYSLDIDDGEYSWNDEMFEKKVKEKVNFEEYKKGENYV